MEEMSEVYDLNPGRCQYLIELGQVDDRCIPPTRCTKPEGHSEPHRWEDKEQEKWREMAMTPRPFAYMRDASTKALVERLARIEVEERHIIHLARVAFMATGRQGTQRKWDDLGEEERDALICHATDAINEARSRA